MGGCRAQVILPRPSGLSAVRQSLRCKCTCAPLALKGKKKPKPTECQRGFWEVSLQVISEVRGHLREGWSPRARNSPCPLPLTALSPLYTLHEAFLGEGEEVLLSSLLKNSLMESSRDNWR